MLARVEARWNGLRELRTELGDVAIGYDPTGGHEIYPEHSPLYTCVAERFDALNATLSPILGPEPFKWANDAIASNGLQGIGHMVRTDLEGPIDTGKLMSRLLQKVLSEGVLIRSNSNVVRIEDGPEQVVILLADGTTLTTAWAVVCTHGYTTDLLPALPVVPARGQVLLTAPIDGLKLRGTFHYDAGFYYFRDFAGGECAGLQLGPPRAVGQDAPAAGRGRRARAQRTAQIVEGVGAMGIQGAGRHVDRNARLYRMGDRRTSKRRIDSRRTHRSLPAPDPAGIDVDRVPPSMRRCAAGRA